MAQKLAIVLQNTCQLGLFLSGAAHAARRIFAAPRSSLGYDWTGENAFAAKSPLSALFLPLAPVFWGEGAGGEGPIRFETMPPHPQPFSPDYRGEGSDSSFVFRFQESSKLVIFRHFQPARLNQP